jgi:Fibronectin type III domain
VKKIWVAAPAVAIAAPLVLAICLSAASTPAPTLELAHNVAALPKFAAPARVTVSTVTPTWATVRFVLPSADRAATGEQVVVYPAGSQGASTAFTATVARSPVTITGLKPSTVYYAEVSVNAVRGRGASSWATSSGFTTGTESVTPASDYSPAAATPTATPPAALTPAAAPTPTPTPASTSGFASISWPTTFNPAHWPSTSAPIPFPAPSPAAPTPTPTVAVTAATPWPTSSAATATASPTLPAATASPASPTTATASPTPTPTPTPTATPTPTPTPLFPTSTPTPTSTSTSAPSSAAGTPYASALSSYSTLAQSYSATDIINGGWAQDANDTNEGGGTCPVANTSYSSSLNAVVLTTAGQPATGGSTDCAHIRSQFTVPTSGDVVEAEIWLPSLSSAATVNGSSYPAGTLLDWASMWTDGANSTNGTENWPADTEIDAVETQYGANYVSVHYGAVAATGGSTGVWTTEPQGWQPAGAGYGTANAGVPNVRPGWNVVDIEFTGTDANIYYNGELFTTVPGSALTHDPAYLNFGISGPNGYDLNYPLWPAGPATEDIQYVKVFT